MSSQARKKAETYYSKHGNRHYSSMYVHEVGAECLLEWCRSKAIGCETDDYALKQEKIVRLSDIEAYFEAEEKKEKISEQYSPQFIEDVKLVADSVGTIFHDSLPSLEAAGRILTELEKVMK